MPGVIEFSRPDGITVKFCLVPDAEPQGPRLFYFPGLPITASPRLTDDRSRFTNPMKAPIVDAVPVFEKDFWAPSDTLHTMSRWLCYPINFNIFRRLPFPVIETLMRSMRTGWQPGRTVASYEIDWGGLSITRKFEVVELAHGVAIWPRRALPSWRQYFMLFAPGDEEGEKKTPFAFVRPTVYSSVEGALVPSDTAVVRAGKAAICRSQAMPRLVALRKEAEDEPLHGVMPLSYDSIGNFVIPTATRDVHTSILGDARLPQVAVDGTAVARLSVDFGTTNTAVAVSLSPNQPGTVLQFADDIRALKLTGPLDPAYELTSLFGFFPMNATPTNPMSTMLIETESGAEPFSGSFSVPRRNIPGAHLVDEMVRPWVSNRFIKQEFKWRKDDTGAELRAAFLEVLARFVGWELRTSSEYQRVRKVQLVFTCPLSFSQDQTAALLRAQHVFKQALEECGFEVTLRAGLVSESLANLWLIRSARAGIGQGLPEERHVVVDIGGGSTDISVFTGEGDAVFLDSLYVGGKDFTEILLANQLDRTEAGRTNRAAVAGIFKSLKSVTNEDDLGGHKALGELLQLLFVLRLERGIESVASDLDNSALKGTAADLLALFAFCTAYGVRIAALGGTVNRKVIPEANDIRVWFVGLGSRLFELSPVARTVNVRLTSARRVLEDACRRVVGPDVRLKFEWGDIAEAKLSVCRGALLVPDSEPALDLKTVFWADFESAIPPVAWSEPYDRDRLMKVDNAVRRSLSTAELRRCAEAAVGAVRNVYDFQLDEHRIKTLSAELQEDYSRGVGKIAQSERDAPQHPVIASTDGLKRNLVGLFRPKGS